jgi:hypothetical protein
VDTTPPETAIQSGPSGTVTSDSATFEFAAEPGSTYECRFDAGPWTPCTSPRTYGGPLSYGPHRFEVRATDSAGWQEASPTGRTFERQPACPTETGSAAAAATHVAASDALGTRRIAVVAAAPPGCAGRAGAA